MASEKADLTRRILAALIDGIVAAVPSVIPVIGTLVGTVYVLTKDALVYEITKQEEWKNRSIGKKLLNLEVKTMGGGDVDLTTSVKRNVPLAIGTLVMIIPVLGWVVGPIVALVFGLIEIFLVLTDARGRRLGDRWAGTEVIDGLSVADIGGGSGGSELSGVSDHVTDDVDEASGDR